MDVKLWRYDFCEREGMMKSSESGLWCHTSHVERLTAERDALQQLLNARDELIDQSMQMLKQAMTSIVAYSMILNQPHVCGANQKDILELCDLAKKISEALENQA